MFQHHFSVYVQSNKDANITSEWIKDALMEYFETVHEREDNQGELIIIHRETTVKE